LVHPGRAECESSNERTGERYALHQGAGEVDAAEQRRHLHVDTSAELVRDQQRQRRDQRSDGDADRRRQHEAAVHVGEAEGQRHQDGQLLERHPVRPIAR
jgi:hypothetical protein